MINTETKIIKNWWELNALKYQEVYKISTDEIYYGSYTPSESRLNLLGDVAGKNIVELGCGGGQASIVLSKRGARCTGVDFCVNQLKYARYLNFYEKTDIRFIEDDIQHLITLESHSFDTAISIFALQYVENLLGCFKQVYRILKPGGEFVFSLDHPFYLTVLPETFKIYNSYFSTGAFDGISGENLVKDEYGGKSAEFIIYKRKISDISNALFESGFLMKKIIEPYSMETGDPWKSMYPENLVKLIGPTIVFQAVKI